LHNPVFEVRIDRKRVGRIWRTVAVSSVDIVDVDVVILLGIERDTLKKKKKKKNVTVDAVNRMWYFTVQYSVQALSYRREASHPHKQHLSSTIR